MFVAPSPSPRQSIHLPGVAYQDMDKPTWSGGIWNCDDKSSKCTELSFYRHEPSPALFQSVSRFVQLASQQQTVCNRPRNAISGFFICTVIEDKAPTQQMVCSAQTVLGKFIIHTAPRCNDPNPDPGKHSRRPVGTFYCDQSTPVSWMDDLGKAEVPTNTYFNKFCAQSVRDVKRMEERVFNHFTWTHEKWEL